MNFENLLIPTIKTKKGEATVTADDFKPLVVKKETPKGDILWKDGRFTLNKSFLEGRNEFTGWLPSYDKTDNKAYFLKSTTEETFANTQSVKGATGTNIFTSESLEYILTNAGIPLENPLYLSYITSANGWDVYEISNVESVNPVIEEIQVKEGPHDSNIVVSTQEQTEAYAQVGVEEASPIAYNYQEESLEQLL